MTKFVTVVGNFLGVPVMVKFRGVLVILLMSATAHAGDIKGIPRVVDGDTLVISKERIRLHGIDSPETRQTCTKDGKVWNCGRDATAALAIFLGWLVVAGQGLQPSLMVAISIFDYYLPLRFGSLCTRRSGNCRRRASTERYIAKGSRWPRAIGPSRYDCI